MNKLLIALILFNIGNILDVITTNIGLSYGLREVNPLIKHLMLVYGINAAIVFKLIVGLILSYVLYFRNSQLTSVIAAILVWIVVTNNLIHIFLRVN